MSRLLGWSASVLSRCDNIFSFFPASGPLSTCCGRPLSVLPLLGAPQHLLWLSAAFSSYPPCQGLLSTCCGSLLLSAPSPLPGAPQHLLWSSAFSSSLPSVGGSSALAVVVCCFQHFSTTPCCVSRWSLPCWSSCEGFFEAASVVSCTKDV